jgi:catechol 2,3-dioxygenase-like lactoylglutathione lyase family enzyme
MTIPATNNESGLSTIGQIALTVTDIARSVSFYRDKLGIRLLFEVPPNMAFFDCSGIRLMLTPPEPEKKESFNSILYFKVADIEATAATLKSRGVEFERDPHFVARMPDHELWLAFLRDPDRNVVGLMCEKKLAN